MAKQHLRTASAPRGGPEPIEQASVDELRVLQLQRLRAAIARANDQVPTQIEAALAAEQSFAPHYILEVTRPDRLDELEVIVETRTVLPPDAAMALADRAVHLIKAYVGVTAAVRAVAPGAIERSQGKAKRVIDKRPRN